jgi:hypothetical protein
MRLRRQDDQCDTAVLSAVECEEYGKMGLELLICCYTGIS